jgi:hypothetical protein
MDLSPTLSTESGGRGAMRLFHFSDDPSIARFEPRPVRIPSDRGPGNEWLNGPLVWAIQEDRQAMYLFPRNCPRILLWQTPETTEADRAYWWGPRPPCILAHIEWAWFDRVKTGRLYRYELPPDRFEDIGNAGMWVSRAAVDPIDMQVMDDLPAALAAANTELRVMPSLVPLRDVWSTSLHASGIRLRHAAGWLAAGAPLTRLLAPEEPSG